METKKLDELAASKEAQASHLRARGGAGDAARAEQLETEALHLRQQQQAHRSVLADPAAHTQKGRGYVAAQSTKAPRWERKLIRGGVAAPEVTALKALFSDRALSDMTTRLGPQGMKQFVASGDLSALKHFEQILDLEKNGQVVGVKDWVDFSVVGKKNTTAASLLDDVAELQDAQRAAKELKPGEKVRIGADAMTRRKTPKAGKLPTSYDNQVTDAAGNVHSNIEVSRIEQPITDAKTLLSGVGHAFAKAKKSTKGLREATVQAEFPAHTIPIQNGKALMRTAADGSWEILEASGASFNPPKTGHILDKLSSSMIENVAAGKVDRFHVIDRSGKVVGEFVHDKTTNIWKRVK